MRGMFSVSDSGTATENCRGKCQRREGLIHENIHVLWVQVKHAFDDAAHAPKLSKIVNHVTVSQFFQVILSCSGFLS